MEETESNGNRPPPLCPWLQTWSTEPSHRDHAPAVWGPVANTSRLAAKGRHIRSLQSRHPRIDLQLEQAVELSPASFLGLRTRTSTSPTALATKRASSQPRTTWTTSTRSTAG